MITKVTKMVPKNYFIIDGVEFAASDIMSLLDDLTCDFDCDIDYYLYSCADKLVKLGYLTKRYGSHQCVIYEDTQDKKARDLFEELLHM